MNKLTLLHPTRQILSASLEKTANRIDAIFLTHQHVKDLHYVIGKKNTCRSRIMFCSMVLAVYTCRVLLSSYIETATAHGKKCTKLSQLCVKIFPTNTKY